MRSPLVKHVCVTLHTNGLSDHSPAAPPRAFPRVELTMWTRSMTPSNSSVPLQNHTTNMKLLLLYTITEGVIFHGLIHGFSQNLNLSGSVCSSHHGFPFQLICAFIKKRAKENAYFHVYPSLVLSRSSGQSYGKHAGERHNKCN